MFNRLHKAKGFTLIELLIAVAIVGILAAVAIPQYAAYRVKVSNTAAMNDVKNLRTSLELYFADHRQYP